MASEIIERNTSLAREYLEWQRKRNRSKETIYIYTQVLQKLLDWMGDTPLAAAHISSLEGFIERPRLRRRPHHAHGQRILGSPATRKRDCTIVRSFYKYLADRGHIGRNPAALLTAPTVHNVHPRAVPDEVWQAVWSHPSLTTDERIFLGLGFFCGLRRNEIVSLAPSNVDPTTGHLVRFQRKGGIEDSFPTPSALRLFQDRLTTLVDCAPVDLVETIVQTAEVRSDRPYLLSWGDRLGGEDDYHLRGGRRRDAYPEGWTPPNILNKRLCALLRRCGMAVDAFTPHALRHSAVTNWLRMGLPLHAASRLAAHADVKTTMRYVSLSDDPFSEVLEASRLERPDRYL